MTITQKFCLLPPDKLSMIFCFKKNGSKNTFLAIFLPIFFIGSSKIWDKKKLFESKIILLLKCILVPFKGHNPTTSDMKKVPLCSPRQRLRIQKCSPERMEFTFSYFILKLRQLCLYQNFINIHMPIKTNDYVLIS